MKRVFVVFACVAAALITPNAQATFFKITSQSSKPTCVSHSTLKFDIEAAHHNDEDINAVGNGKDTLEWTSNNSDVATFKQPASAELTCVAPGTVTIKVTGTFSGHRRTAKMKVQVAKAESPQQADYVAPQVLQPAPPPSVNSPVPAPDPNTLKGVDIEFGTVAQNGTFQRVKAEDGTYFAMAYGEYVDPATNNTSTAPLTTGVTWAVDPNDNSVLIIDPNTGLITPKKPGASAKITATWTGTIQNKPVSYTNTTSLKLPAAPSGRPTFAETPQSPNIAVKVRGSDQDTVVVHQLADSSTLLEGQPCTTKDLADGQVVSLVVNNTPADQATISGSGTINTLTLSKQLTPGMKLCLEETAGYLGAATNLSLMKVVHDPNDFGRFRPYMTVGVQITNQQPTTGSGATQSSTAGEYLELGLVHSFFRPAPYIKTTSHFHPGAAGVFDVRLSPVPVSAPVTTPAPATANAPASTSTPTISSLNLLSSQQSVRVVSQLAAPFWAGSWQGRYNVTTLSPLAKAGFMTLLNPSTAGTNAAGNLVTSNFSPTYSFFGFGGRLGWDRISADPDEAPQMITKLDVTLAKYSNLPSYLCTNDKTKLGPTTITTTDANGKSTTTQNFSFPTACGQPNGTQAPNAFISRTLAYRLDIEALAKLPQYPFVLGVMANLAQYTVGHNGNIDYLNKPGNDIRLFIGLTLPLSQLGDLLKGK